jgi:predicted phage baseplate assembly protein
MRLTLPAAPAWSSQAPTKWTGTGAPTPKAPADEVKDELFWLGVRIVNRTAGALQVGIDYLLFNSAPAHNALKVPAEEVLGRSNGQPFQTFALANRPLFKQPGADAPYGHLHVAVQAPATPPAPSPPPVEWVLVDELPAGPGNFFRLDPVTGEVTFGNFGPGAPGGHGSIPSAGSTVKALSYRYVAGGAAGNVPPGQVGSLRTHVPGIIGVTNVFAAYDGADEEPIEDTMRRAPEKLRTRDRAVTAEDYENLALAAGTDVARVRCLEPAVQEQDGPGSPPAWKKGDPWTFANIDRSPGNVTVIIVPVIDPNDPDAWQKFPRPEPTKDLLHTVQTYLDARRSLTAHLAVTGPRYLPVKVTVNVAVWKRARDQGLIAEFGDVTAAMQVKLRKFLHPLLGGPDGRGWQVGQSVFSSDVFKAIMPSENVGFISQITLEADVPAYHPAGTPFTLTSSEKERPFTLTSTGPWVRLADYELVCYSDNSVVHAPVPV